MTTVWRRNLVIGDPLRDWCYYWDRNGVGDAGLVAEGEVLPRPERVAATSPGWQRHHWEESLHCGVRALAPGRFRLMLGNVDCGQINAITPLPRRGHPVVVPPGVYDPSTLEQILAVSDVTLAPGEHRLTRAMRLPPGATIRGFGARLVKISNPADQYDHLIKLANRCTLIGLTVVCADAGSAAFVNDHAGNELVASQCRFEDGMLGHWASEGSLFDRCEFVRFSTGPFRGQSMMAGCRWQGHALAGHSYVIAGGANAMLNCGFDGTDRGIVLVPAQSHIENGLYAGVNIRGLHVCRNGNEVLGCDDAPFAVRNNMFLRIHASDCQGQVNWWGAETIGNVIRGCTFDGVTMSFSGRRLQRDNIIEDCEFDGCGIQFDGAAKSNTVRRVIISGVRPTGANQTPGTPGPMPAAIWATEATYTDGQPTNRVTESLRVTGLPAGTAATVGVSVATD